MSYLHHTIKSAKAASLYTYYISLLETLKTDPRLLAINETFMREYETLVKEAETLNKEIDSKPPRDPLFGPPYRRNLVSGQPPVQGIHYEIEAVKCHLAIALISETMSVISADAIFLYKLQDLQDSPSDEKDKVWSLPILNRFKKPPAIVLI